MPRGDSPRRRLAGAGNMPQAAALCLIFPSGCCASYDSAYTLLFSGLAVVTLLCALMIWLTLCRKGRYPNPQQWILNPLIARWRHAPGNRLSRSAQRTGIVIVR